ncbi:hypothetical protein LMG26858_03392 [Achromobacter anxifer]|uniref:Glycosyltransferase RgtA/B/C/D-like domain-containing protein n=1 Tax=Achromobacter anxifer TaxID=1287737 RepID=A0A6S7D969_9BURK|nr:hypothetical protein [Achromobacter anxifer]CAB3884270.1 hypothetical protein LMG26858_03392 [Achromobacter anxifer]
MIANNTAAPRPAGRLILVGDLLSLVVLAGFAALLIAGAGLPLYSDEVVTKWGQARFFEPDGVLSSFFPQCRAAFSSPLPWAFYPGAAFFSALYGNLPPLGLRLAGVAVALVVLAGFGLWARRSTRSTQGALSLLSVLIVLLALGALPFLWVMSRPEQWLTLGLIFFCMTATVSPRHDAKAPWIWPVLYFPVASAFFFVHPKSVFFAPVVLLAAWLVTRRRHPAIRVLLVAWVLWTSYTTYRWGTTVSNCPEAPGVQATLSSNFLSPSLLFQAPVAFLLEGIGNLLSAPGKIAEHALFAATFQSGWLAPMAVPAAATWMNSIIQILVEVAIFGTLATGLLWLPATWLRGKPATPQPLLAAALALGLCANFFFFKYWFFYGAAQVLPLVLMMLLLAMPARAPAWLARPGLQLARSAWLLFALASMAIFAAYIAPEVWKRSNPPEASVPDQWLSVPALGFDQRRETIRELANQCGIRGDGAEHLVVDHLTYYAFSHLRRPIHALYVSELAYGADLPGEKLIRFLQGLESPGAITQCGYLPAALSVLHVIRKGGYCCAAIPPAN